MILVRLTRRLINWLILWRAIKLGLRVGKDLRISGRPFFGGEPYLISIGDHVTISFNVSFINHDGATWVFRDRPEYQGLQRFGRIDIGDNVFVGANTTILPGVTIGSNVVVGAGSVVTKDLPSDGVYAGVPARFVCTIEEYTRRTSARCTYYPPEVARSGPRLRQALIREHPFRPRPEPRIPDGVPIPAQHVGV